MPTKGYKHSKSARRNMSIAQQKRHRRERRVERQGKRFGPMQALGYKDGNLAAIDVVQESSKAIPTLTGYISSDTYDDLLVRYNILQLELADRDVMIAEMSLELAQLKRDSIYRVSEKWTTEQTSMKKE